tara:strand:- start:176 stop:538 length:363 start_codon:yes stop_codon:yes gene_type:complete
MIVEIESFGFLYGVPSGRDYIVDARILDLRGHGIDWDRETGLGEKVAAIAASDPAFAVLVAIGAYAVGLVEAAKRDRVRIGVGCLHGRHRSVAVAEALAARLTLSDHNVQVRHRELDKTD